jgi:hypothetical protein
VVTIYASHSAELELSDQFGRHYRCNGSTTSSITGDVVVFCDAVVWPASLAGARLHLHGSRLDVLPGGRRTDSGDWSLDGTLRVDEGRSLPMPAAGSLGAWPFRFQTVRATEAFLIVDWEIPGIDATLFDRIPDGLKGRDPFSITLSDSAGTESRPQNGSSAWSGSSRQGVRGRSVFVRRGSGDYRLRVRLERVGEFERTISVPN